MTQPQPNQYDHSIPLPPMMRPPPPRSAAVHPSEQPPAGTLKELAWAKLLAQAAGIGDFAIGFVDGDKTQPVATIGYYSDRPQHCYDLDEYLLPAETPEWRAFLEERIAESVRDMHNGGHAIAPSKESLSTMYCNCCGHALSCQHCGLERLAQAVKGGGG